MEFFSGWVPPLHTPRHWLCSAFTSKTDWDWSMDLLPQVIELIKTEHFITLTFKSLKKSLESKKVS
jgi:hypothetical protein